MHYCALLTEFRQTSFDISFNIQFYFQRLFVFKREMKQFHISLSDFLEFPWKIYKNLNSDLDIFKNLRNSNDIFCLFTCITEIHDEKFETLLRPRQI